MTDEQLLEAVQELISREDPSSCRIGSLRGIRVNLRASIAEDKQLAEQAKDTKKQQAIHHAEKLIELLKS